MEWSDRDDAWGDEPNRQRGEEPAESRPYPPAPVPAHERQWRHPSELGHVANQAWAVAEPPVALGRGLLVATGMVGCALGVAILWLLVPAGGDAPTADVAGPNRAAATATRPTQPAAADRTGDDETTSSAAGTTFASLAPTTVRPATTAGGAPDGSGVLPGEDPPANTVLVAHDDEEPAVAVLLGDSPFLVTTANAIGDLEQIEITFDGGDVGTATVVSIGDSVAYLASDDPTIATIGFSHLAAPSSGDTVYALGNEVVSFAFGDPVALADAPDDALAEGTPVVDDRGALVGLCTHGDEGWGVVAIAPPPDDGATTTSTTATSTTGATATTTVGTEQPTAYLGVSLGLDDGGHVTVLSVTAGSPADLAGIIAGQRILALDGVPLASPAELITAVRAHRPGDAIQLTLSAATAPSTSSPLRETSTTSVGPTGSTAAGSSTAAIAPSTSAAGATTSTSTGSTGTTTTLAPPTSGQSPSSVPTSSQPSSGPTSSSQPTSTSTTGTTATTATTVPDYGMPTYTVTVVLGEHAPNV